MKEDSAQTEKSSDLIYVKGDDLNSFTTFCYTIGHILNDLCASCWFYFMGYYLVFIKGLLPFEAGLALFFGQLSDAISTSIVTLYSDKIDTKYGKRTPWYVVGTILSITGFLFIFKCSEDTHSLAYYICFSGLFNVGWSMVQVSHFTLLPSITISICKQEYMTRMRTAFCFAAQLIALILSLIIFYFANDKSKQFTLLSFTCVTFGLIPTIMFLMFFRETELTKNISAYSKIIREELTARDSKMRELATPVNINSESEEAVLNNDSKLESDRDETIEQTLNWKYWTKKRGYFIFMLIYVFVRLSINIVGSMIPFYCKNILQINKEDGSTPIEISMILISKDLGSIINSIYIEHYIISKFGRLHNRLVVFILATTAISLGCLPLFFLNADSAEIMIVLSFLIGIGFSAGLSGAISFINDFVSDKGNRGGFVFGSYSFVDKISCGIVLIFMLQAAQVNYSILRLSLSVFPPLIFGISLLIVIVKKYECSPNIDHMNDDKTLSDPRISFY